MNDKNREFTFNISLSVLNHLGRNLYRSFTTVIGEAISNAWDAEADNVWIYINKEADTLVIKDDGYGMSRDDFQNKFLKIGYSKRKAYGQLSSKKKRPYIGRKGIGKLALLSCSEKVSVISKKETTDYVGGVITNKGLNSAIENDMTPQDYSLDIFNLDDFSSYTESHSKGTIILFEGLKGGIKNSLEFIRKTLALYFRFSLLDNKFSIFVDDKKINFNDLGDLKDKTEFCWTVNAFKDPFVDFFEHLKEKHDLKFSLVNVKGFVASVGKPSNMTIKGMGEKLTVDLFVNGRLREKNILRNIASNRVPETYIFGQLHYDSLDGKDDPFTSGRESIVSDNLDYQEFLDKIKKEVISKVIDQWDRYRISHRESGDAENTDQMKPKQRKADEFYNETIRDYTNSANKSKQKKVIKSGVSIDDWIEDLREDAIFCFSSYADCYLSENLIRKHILVKGIDLSDKAKKEIEAQKCTEKKSKGAGNISINIREDDQQGLGYLSMIDLASLADMNKGMITKKGQLFRDAKEYKPMRDALMHTSRLTDVAKKRLTTVFENIKGRVIKLLNQ